MATKNTLTTKEVEKVTVLLEKLVVQGKFSHLKGAVDTLISGALIPTLIEQGQLDPNDPEVAELMKMQPAQEVTRVVKERKVYRRIKENGVNKEINKKRELSTAGRDVLIRWWNVNQRLIPDGDPVCVTLAAQVNALTPKEEPLSNMQIAGYFSHLCRMGLRTEEDREERFRRSKKRGAHTIIPQYTKSLLDAIYANWEFERKNEEAIHQDHGKMVELREKGIYTPVVAKVV